jgi:hypothetical protein
MATRSHGLFRQVPRPAADAAKGGCYVYGTTGPGVDTGVLIDFEGTLYLSNTAIIEMAEVAGFSLNEDGAQLEVRNAFLEHENEKLRGELAELNEQLDAVAITMARARK